MISTKYNMSKIVSFMVQYPWWIKHCNSVKLLMFKRYSFFRIPSTR